MERWRADTPGARLHRKRKRLRLTQAELGAMFGLSRTMVFEWEAGRIPVPAEVEEWLRLATPNDSSA